MKLVFNIGLENNPLEPWTISQHLRNVPYNTERTIQYSLTTSTYKGEKEKTMVCKFNTNRTSIGHIITQVEALCKMLEQECIAITIDGLGYLVYDTSIPTSERMTFDPQYFINY